MQKERLTMFTTFKCWALKNGCREDEVTALVREAIIPAYLKLPGCLGLGLLRIEGTQSYLATQSWESRTAYDAALSSETYSNWWSAYLPALERWDAMMTFEDEWETVDVLGE
jgi:quinol monooxygenase YgiN